MWLYIISRIPSRFLVLCNCSVASQEGHGILCVYNFRDSQPMPCSLSAMVVCLSQDRCVYGVQWLSDRVLDSLRCVLEQDTLILA